MSGLQKGGDAKDDHANREEIGDRVSWDAGGTENENWIDEIDGDQANMLDAIQCNDGRWRRVTKAVDQAGRLFCSRHTQLSDELETSKKIAATSSNGGCPASNLRTSSVRR